MNPKEQENTFRTLLSKPVAIILGILILIISLLRENVFLELNAIIDKEPYNKAYFYFFQESFTQLPYQKLMQLKWLLTGGFSLLITILSYFTIYFLFRNKNFNKLALVFYASIFGLLMILTTVFYGFNLFDNYYFILRKIAGFIQSPLPLLLLLILIIYLKSNIKIP